MDDLRVLQNLISVKCVRESSTFKVDCTGHLTIQLGFKAECCNGETP